MRKTIIALALLLATVSASAGIKFGIRGGVNVTNVSIADVSGISKTGFYLGPTLKLGLPLGFDIDASLLYNQLEADPDIYVTQADYPTVHQADDPTGYKGPNIKRKAISIPLNLRKGFGFGDNASIFLFAGPQISWNIGDKSITEYYYKWKSADISVNAGVGVMLLKRIEVKANYTFPCSSVGESEGGEPYDWKLKGWQIGMAIYL